MKPSQNSLFKADTYVGSVTESRILGPVHGSHGKVTPIPYSTGTVTFLNPHSLHELETQTKDIQTAVEALSSRIESASLPEPESSGESLTVKEELQDLRNRLTQLQATTSQLTAPVSLPTRENLEVRLVPSTSLERLEEYRSEESKWYSFLGVFLGALLDPNDEIRDWGGPEGTRHE